MIIDTLSLLDFKVFSGSHSFDLAPRVKRGASAPIVLFGGLNGGGKTTILSALKLALYGKGVLGSGATVADYHGYLKDCVHRAHNSIAKPIRAAVELSFRYAEHGVISSYHLVRDWYVEGGSRVKEGLIISKNGVSLNELSYDQAQSFLNELIPIGVSELFFFDGEKISSLAEETTGEALRDSINKLLGLDVIDKLDSDLSVLIRTRAAKKASADRQKGIADAEAEFLELKASLENSNLLIHEVNVEIAECRSNISNIKSNIDSRGGAWSRSKQQEAAQLDTLLLEKKSTEAALHEKVSGLLPLAIVRKLGERLIKQLDAEVDLAKTKNIADYLISKRAAFALELKKILPVADDRLKAIEEVYDSTFGAEIGAIAEESIRLHQLSGMTSSSIAHRLLRVLPSECAQVSQFTKKLDDLDLKIDSAGENISRAPEESVLIPLFTEQGLLQGRLGELNGKRDYLIARAKDVLNQLSPVARRLDELHAEVELSTERERVFNSAQRVREVLAKFSMRARDIKLKELELKFFTSFNQLARKDDRKLSISVAASSFEVTLLDDTGEAIRKNELSAGEKQIFAISILEALARTSGRSLPVVIDTPLGRLDSVHRKKLVDNYFPTTSHQVVILSTDTEIDAGYYEQLLPHVSHSYHLKYNAESRSTEVEEGYFWRWGQQV